MKIAELIKQMEKATEHIKGNGIKVREIHGDVIPAIKAIAAGVGLEARIWDITLNDEYGRHNSVLTYGVDFTEDKRYKNDRVGKLHKVTFQPAQNFISLDDTVEEAADKVNYVNAKNNLERLQGELEKLYLEVNKYKGYIVDVQAEVLDLSKKIKLHTL